MQMRARNVVALTAGLLLALAACSGSPSKSKDDKAALDGQAIDLSKPKLEVAAGGAWLLSASFTWRTCGERACFAYDEGRHGGPDVFGVFVKGVPVRVSAAKLILQSSCHSQTTLGEARTSEMGAYFLVQDESEKKGPCAPFESERAFNMASGMVEAVVVPVAGAACQGLLSVTSLFGHSYGDAGRDVRVAADPGPGNPHIEWGDDARQKFHAIPNSDGIYDCSGAEK